MAVSGGPDSVALARALVNQEREIVGKLVIAHLNHQLRGPESDMDEAFVGAMFASFRTPYPRELQLRCERMDVASLAKREGGNLENVGRRLRYDWLAQVAVQEGLSLVATGHSADDQAETILHRLLRGTGLKGLRGIAGRRHLASGVVLMRPLLEVTRTDILHYLEDVGQSYRQDSSNQDLRYMRNRIRHELLPQLAEQYNPALVSILCRLAKGAGELFQWQEAKAASVLAKAECPRAGKVIVLNRTTLEKTPRHLLREIFRLLWTRESWPEGQMDFDAWDRLAGLVLGESTALDLPEGLHAVRRERVVQVGRGS
ncbi:MAG TPA: tRNA lysidine(34) synthetase TilS [Gemmataceae bacterium]|nr:tRNA lysidine(34) synthetase TilS [Gemmataceae bacterium]